MDNQIEHLRSSWRTSKVHTVSAFTFYISLFLVGVVLLSSAAHRTILAFTVNRHNLLVDQIWLHQSNLEEGSDQLADGIPDHWAVSNWASSRARFDVEPIHSLHGVHSVYIQKNNLVDGAVIYQAVSVVPNNKVVCRVFHQGTEAFLQILGNSVNVATTLPGSESWQEATLEFQIPENENSVTVILGMSSAQGTAHFDDAECSVSTGPANNLLANGGFEKDGLPFDPQNWWVGLPKVVTSDLNRLNASRDVLAQRLHQSSAQINRLMMIDLLSGRFGEVAKRAELVSRGCLEQGGNQAPLLDLAHRWGDRNGLAEEERLLLSAIAIMPMCPQAYAQLAELYASTGAYGKAGDYYQLASQHSVPGAQQGGYAFYAGMIRVETTGEWEAAIAALKIAEQNQGWEQVPWYYGAATSYLAKALSEVGRCHEAADAYTRVLACTECNAHHADAHNALEKLRTCLVS